MYRSGNTTRHETLQFNGEPRRWLFEKKKWSGSPLLRFEVKAFDTRKIKMKRKHDKSKRYPWAELVEQVKDENFTGQHPWKTQKRFHSIHPNNLKHALSYTAKKRTAFFFFFFLVREIEMYNSVDLLVLMVLLSCINWNWKGKRNRKDIKFEVLLPSCNYKSKGD